MKDGIIVGYDHVSECHRLRPTLWGSETLIVALIWALALRQHPARDLVRGLSAGPSAAGAGRPARPVAGKQRDGDSGAAAGADGAAPAATPAPAPVGFQNLATPSELRSRGWLVFVQETAEDCSAGDPSGWSGGDRVVRAWWA